MNTSEIVASAMRKAEIRNNALRAMREARADLARANTIQLAEIVTCEREINAALSAAFKAEAEAEAEAGAPAPAPAPSAPAKARKVTPADQANLALSAGVVMVAK